MNDGVSTEKGIVQERDGPKDDHLDWKICGLAVEAADDLGKAHTECDGHDDDLNAEACEHDEHDLAAGGVYGVYCGVERTMSIRIILIWAWTGNYVLRNIMMTSVAASTMKIDMISKISQGAQGMRPWML